MTDQPIVTTIMVAVCVPDASDIADANRRCRQLPAYGKLLAQYPSSRWDRRHVKTEKHIQSGHWLVEFEMKRKGKQ